MQFSIRKYFSAQLGSYYLQTEIEECHILLLIILRNFLPNNRSLGSEFSALMRKESEACAKELSDLCAASSVAANVIHIVYS